MFGKNYNDDVYEILRKELQDLTDEKVIGYLYYNLSIKYVDGVSKKIFDTSNLKSNPIMTDSENKYSYNEKSIKQKTVTDKSAEGTNFYYHPVTDKKELFHVDEVLFNETNEFMAWMNEFVWKIDKMKTIELEESFTDNKSVDMHEFIRAEVDKFREKHRSKSEKDMIEVIKKKYF